nr:CBS domain-containing protein [Rappaport israeli]
MTPTPHHTTTDQLAAQALELMETYHITSLPVLEQNRLIGILHIHDLLSAGIA